MPSNIVLVTGVGGELGGKLLARLGNNLEFERVIGVDTTPPRKAGGDRNRSNGKRSNVHRCAEH